MAHVSLCRDPAPSDVLETPLALPELGQDGALPEWIPIFPAGETIRARDGRSWAIDPGAVIERTRLNGPDPPLDENHATEFRGRYGGESPACGWMTEFEVRADGSTWGRVDWTDKGAAMVRSREYRYTSPAFKHFQDSEGRRQVERITSVGLVNLPALNMPSLTQEEPRGNPTMNETELAALRATFGLEETATAAEIVAAASSRATPSLAEFVPRADYDAQVARATTAEQAIATSQREAQETEITQVVDKAVADGKIAPASAGYHKTACAAEGGLDRFRAMVDAAPSIGRPSAAGDAQPPGPGGGAPRALTAEESQVALAMGLTDDQMREVA